MEGKQGTSTGTLMPPKSPLRKGRQDVTHTKMDYDLIPPIEPPAPAISHVEEDSLTNKPQGTSPVTYKPKTTLHIEEEPQTTTNIEDKPQTTPSEEKVPQTASSAIQVSKATPDIEKGSQATSAEKKNPQTTLYSEQDLKTTPPEEKDPQTDTHQKHDTYGTLPKKQDTQAESPKKQDTQTDVPVKKDIQVDLPEKQDTQIDSPEKKDIQTGSPEKQDTQTESPEKKDTQTDSHEEQDTQIALVPSMDNIQSTSSATDTKGEPVKKREKKLMEVYSDNLKNIAYYWLSSWYEKKPRYYMNGRSFWERVYRGIFWLAQNPKVPSDNSLFIPQNDDITLINSSFINCPRLMDYIVYFMEVILHPEMIDTSFAAEATEDIAFSILSKPQYLESVYIFVGNVYKVYQQAIKEDVQDLQQIRDRSTKTIFYGLLSLFEPRLQGDKFISENLLSDWNRVFLGTKKSINNVSSGDVGLTTLLQQIQNFKKNIDGENMFSFGPIVEQPEEAWSVSERDTGFLTWTMKEESTDSNDHKRINTTAHANLIAGSALDFIRNIVNEAPGIVEPLDILRKSFEVFHGGFDPFYIQLFRTQLKKVFTKNNYTITFDPLTYMCVVDTFSDIYNEEGPAIVDKMDFEYNGFQFNLEYVETFVKEILPEQVEFTMKKTTINEVKNMFDFNFNDGEFSILAKKFEYAKTNGFPLYRDKGEALIYATDVSCHLTLSILNNEVQVEYCKCKIGMLNVHLHKSTKNSVLNFFLMQEVKIVMKRKLQAFLEQVFTNTFTNIFL